VSGLRQIRIEAGIGVAGWNGQSQAFLFKVASVSTLISPGAVFPLDAHAALQVHDASNIVRFAVRSPLLSAPVGGPGILLTFAPSVAYVGGSGATAGTSPRWVSCPLPEDLWLTPGEYLTLDLDLGAGSDAIVSAPIITVLRPS